MRVSIIIPVYNVEQYIEDCLISVAQQKYQNIECLIIDDCGSDRSIEIADTFIKKYEGAINFNIIHRTVNGGLSEARNTGIREAKGDYLYFLDSDDEISNDAISYLAEKVLEKNFDMACAEFAHTKEEINSNAKPIEEEFWNENVCFAIRKRNNGWNKLVRRSLIIENALFFESGIYHEDRLWNFTLNVKLKSVFWSNKITYIYRVRPNSIITDSSKMKKRIDDSVYIIKKMETVFLLLNAITSNHKRIVHNYVESERYGVCISAFELSKEKAKQIFDDLNPHYSIAEFYNLYLANKIRNLCWILGKHIGFKYVYLFYTYRYRTKI